MNHKILLSLLLLLLSGKSYSQTEITDKGYFYSPNGFTCKNGSLYTADMKTMVRSCSVTDALWEKEGYDMDDYYYIIYIPSGAEIIPSNLIYSNEGKQYGTGYSRRYLIVIPSSVKYIATDAFMVPFLAFFSGETDSSSNVPISRAAQNTWEIARYNIQGHKIEKPQKGINIVQMSDQTVHKEIVK